MNDEQIQIYNDGYRQCAKDILEEYQLSIRSFTGPTKDLIEVIKQKITYGPPARS